MNSHFAAYNSKVVEIISKPELGYDDKFWFHIACMRIIDNNFSGFVLTPKKELFKVLQGKKTALRVKVSSPEYASALSLFSNHL